MKTFLATLLTLSSTLFFSCSFNQSEPSSSILVTIPVYAAIIQSLTENQIPIQILVPPGADPHTYEPKPDQIRHFTQASIWFRIGESIENKLVKLLESYPVKIVNISHGKTDLLEEAHHGHHHAEAHDLHLWMDPLLLLKQVEEMRDHLIQSFPQRKDQIQLQAERMIQKLNNLDHKIEAQLACVKGHTLLVSHPAFGYFCKRYHLHQLSVEMEGKDPLPQDIAALMGVNKAVLIPFVILEPQYSSKGAKLIAQQLDLPCEEIDPYTFDYFDMLNHLSDLIQTHHDAAS
ncbi:MAG: zinc ABC transporter substrate-binding protein [Candidatus Rhabdochlamydia sp.]